MNTAMNTEVGNELQLMESKDAREQYIDRVEHNVGYLYSDITKLNIAKLSVCGVYKIKNKINGKVYIGSSRNIYKRWKEHIRHLQHKKHHSIYLQRSWDKYGSENFIFSILERVCSNDILLDKEQFWIDNFLSFGSKYIYITHVSLLLAVVIYGVMSKRIGEEKYLLRNIRL